MSLIITAFHSCCLSHHVFFFLFFDLWPAKVGFETDIFWQCSPETVETQRFYPLHHGPRRAIKDGFFGLINPYLVFYSRVRTEVYLVKKNKQTKKTWCDRQQLWKAVITGDTVTRLIIPIRGRGKNHLKKARGEIWPKRSERRNNTKSCQDEDKKSAINKN